MDIKLIIAVLTSITAIALAYLNYRLSRKTSRNDKNAELRTQSYVDFVNAVSEIATTSGSSASRSKESLKKLVDAKTRIAIYGDSEVIIKMAEFDKKHGLLNDEPSMESFMSIALAMRKASIGVSKQSLRNEIRQVLFGNERDIE